MSSFYKLQSEYRINLDEGLTNKIINYSIKLAKDPYIQTSAKIFITSIIGKGIDGAFEFLNKKLEKKTNIPREKNIIKNRVEAREVFKDYIANSSVEKISKEEKKDVSISKMDSTKQKIKNIFNKTIKWLGESENEFEYEIIEDMKTSIYVSEDLKTFEEFISENQIFEAQFGNEKVIIFPGRFQPFHNGHIAALKKAHDIFRLPVVPVQILSKTDKSPFDDGLLMTIGQAVAKEFDWMAGYSLYPPGLKTVVPQMIKYLRAQYNFEPVGMGCGSDRLKAYEPQVKYLNSDRTDVPVSEPFRLEICDERAAGGPSGTKVREAITADDQKLFEELTPKSVHKFYKDLKKSLS